MKNNESATGDLLEGIRTAGWGKQTLAEGAVLLRGFADADSISIFQTVQQVIAAAPFRQMITPGGRRMSVAMTNCGQAGWVTDLSGYRYDALDPVSRRPWPPMPEIVRRLAERAAAQAGFMSFQPDSCLINRYEPGARLSLHQDRDERDFGQPIVSLSLGLPAIFLFGGQLRNERTQRMRLESGDVVVWGGASRLAFHGVAPLAEGRHPLTGRCRINLTFRKAL
jgi:alkylated DNA repair protein (DNA oxidative demethylase)